MNIDFIKIVYINYVPYQTVREFVGEKEGFLRGQDSSVLGIPNTSKYVICNAFSMFRAFNKSSK